jgi:protocatechuate 3,4-dioxygenase beta subunit
LAGVRTANPAHRRRPLVWWLIASVLIAASLILIARNRVRESETGKLSQAEPARPSAWVVPPRLITPLTRDPAWAPPTRRGPALEVRVEDVTGGVIPHALVRAEGEGGREFGRTDSTGSLKVDASGLPPVLGIVASADGYAPTWTLAPVPGMAVLRLVPATHVSGRVVEADSGKPVPGLTVRCDGQETTSAADGAFALDGVSPGRHRIEARGEGWRGTLAEPFKIGPADTVSDLRVEVTRAFSLAGRVTAEGQPQPGRTIEVWSAGGTLSVLTDADGHYRHSGLVPGRYQVAVTRSGAMPTYVERAVSIVDRDVTLDIQLDQRSKVAFEVVDDLGRPLAGIAVHVTQKRAAMQASPLCTTDARGTCSVSDLWPGVLTYETDSEPKRTATAPRATPIRLVVSARGGIRGRLIRSDGRPVGDRYVVASRRGGSGHVSAHSDNEGRFQISLLPAGVYDVEVYLRNAISAATPREASTAVTLEPGQVAELLLEVPSASGAIAGRVVDEAGATVRDALVTYDYLDSWSKDVFRRGLDLSSSDDHGAFRFDDVLRHYRYVVTAYTRDGRLGTVASVAAGATDVIVRIERLVDLTVEVNGFRSPQVTVEIWRNEAIETSHTGDGSGARYHFDNLQPGPINVVARTADERAEASATLEAGRAATVRLRPAVSDLR